MTKKPLTNISFKETMKRILLVKSWRRNNVIDAFCLSSGEHLVRVETSHAIHQLLLSFSYLDRINDF
jgi:hypothetical protein